MTEVSSWPPWMPIPNSSAELGRPPWSGGTNGCTRNVRRPRLRRSSRQATPSSAVLPPWALRNTSRSAPVVAADRPTSAITASSVSLDSHNEPGDQECSSDLETESVGSNQASASSPHSATAARADSSAIT